MKSAEGREAGDCMRIRREQSKEDETKRESFNEGEI